jgi:hypothetical protein
MNKSSRRADLRLVHPTAAAVGVRAVWWRKFRARDWRIHPFMDDQRALERQQFLADLRVAAVIVGAAACAVVLVLCGPQIWHAAASAGWVRP